MVITFILFLLLFSCSVVSGFLWYHGLQHTRLSCPSPTPGACSNLCPLSRWCHPTILSSAFPSPPDFYLSQHQCFFFPIFTLNVPYVNKILHEGKEQFQSSEIRTVFDVFYSESYYFYIAQERLFFVVVVCLFWWLNFVFFSYCSRFLFNSHCHVSQILNFHLCTWHLCQYLRIISKLYYKGNIQWCNRVRFFCFWIENFSSLFSNITLMAWNQLQWEFHSMEIDCLCLCLIFLEGWMFNIYQHIPKSIAPSYGLYHIHVEGKE